MLLLSLASLLLAVDDTAPLYASAIYIPTDTAIVKVEVYSTYSW